jgi:probable F420-dependent oxidoreductase
MERPGIVIFGGGLDTVAGVAERAEVLGFDSVWTTEFYDRSATITLAVMAERTERITLGSAIAYAVGRSPLVLAAEARDLDELSDGRLVLGLGTGTRRMMEDWHGASSESPAVRMEELVPLLRRFWTLDKEGIDHEGRFYRTRLVPTGVTRSARRQDLPIYLAGVNPRMIKAAGAVGDGLVGHPLFTPRYVTEIVRPALADGAKHAGRDADDVAIAGYLMCAVSDDGDTARREAKAQIAFYSIVRSYDAIMALHGWRDHAASAREAWKAGDPDGMVAAVTDEMLETIAVTGTPDEVRDQLRDREGLFDRTLLYAPSYGVEGGRLEENLHAILDAGRP